MPGPRTTLDADGYFVSEKLDADDVQAARATAISYAAYRLLLHRYSFASGLQETFDELVRPGVAATASTTSTRPATHRRRSATASRRLRSARARGRRGRGAPLRRSVLHPVEPAARRLRAGRADARSEPLATAGARATRRPERHAAARPRAVVHRPALGPRRRLRAPAALRGRHPDRSRSPPRLDGFAGPGFSGMRSPSSATAPASIRRTAGRSTSGPARGAGTRSAE